MNKCRFSTRMSFQKVLVVTMVLAQYLMSGAVGSLMAQGVSRVNLGLEPPSVIWGQILVDGVSEIKVEIHHGNTLQAEVVAHTWEADSLKFYRAYLPSSFVMFSESKRKGGELNDTLTLKVDGTAHMLDAQNPVWNNQKILRYDIEANNKLALPSVSLIDTNVWIFEGSDTQNAKASLRALLADNDAFSVYGLSWKRVLSASVEDVTTDEISLSDSSFPNFEKSISGQSSDETDFAGHWLISALPQKADGSISSVSRTHYYGTHLRGLFFSYGGAPANGTFLSPGTEPVQSSVQGTSMDCSLVWEKSEFANASISDGQVLSVALTSTAASGVTTYEVTVPVTNLPADTEVYSTEILSLSGFISKDLFDKCERSSNIQLTLSHEERGGSSQSVLSIPFSALKRTMVNRSQTQGYWWKGFSYLDIEGGLSDGKLIKIEVQLKGDIPSAGEVLTVEEFFVGEPLAEMSVY